MWELYEQGELRPHSELTGVFHRDAAPADAVGVMRAIDDARDEAIRRALARDEPLG
jgi:RIO kinase 1